MPSQGNRTTARKGAAGKLPAPSKASPNINPRRPGLEPILPNGKRPTSHADLVELAENDLIRILQDPYYYEALQRLLRKKNQAVVKRAGLLSSRGRIAERLQGSSTRSMRKAGPAPASGLDGFTLLGVFNHWKSNGKWKSVSEFATWFAKVRLPAKRGSERRRLATAVKQQIYNARRADK